MNLDKLLNVVQLGLHNRDPTVIGVLLSLLLVLITIIFLAFRGSSKKKRGILLLGLTDAGKTLMFTQLVFKQYKKTFTSIKENSGNYQLSMGKSGTLRLVALPGHERLRTTFLEQYRNQARGIIYTIDSVAFQKEVKDVAEYLYSILVDDILSRSGSKVLIACTKQDQPLAKGIKVIKSHLEKEMNTVRRTQSAALESLYGSTTNKYLGKKNTDFSFDHLKSTKVQFVECTSTGGQTNGNCKPDLTAVETWLHSVA